MNRYSTVPSGASNAIRAQEAVLLDMHVHSDYSTDSVVSVGAIVRAWEKTGVLPLVCDHNSIEGSREVYTQIRRQDPNIPLILAEEVSTRDGEIIGAFLTEKIPPGLSAAETLDCIRDQGGLSIVPHPFCPHRLCTIDRGVLQELIGRIDVVEAYNARNRSPGSTKNRFRPARMPTPISNSPGPISSSPPSRGRRISLRI